MKRTIIFFTVLSAFMLRSQTLETNSWSLVGNAGTVPGTHFIGTTDNKDLVFKTNDIQRIRIANNGNLYFGNPGDISYYGINLNHTFVTSGTNAFYLTNNTGAFKVIDGGTGWNYIRVAASDEYDSVIYLQEDGGKVLIGGKSTNLYNCTSCAGYKLFVKDGIKTEKVKVEIAAENGWADYVFDKDYKLMDLKRLESFIQENKHLPEVPTTEDAIANGIELKEMNILLLKKVEELTLHMIDLNKKLEKQNEEIRVLKSK